MNGAVFMSISTNITIFGGTGDLTFRKLLPAFYNMYVNQELVKDARILIIGRRNYDSITYRSLAMKWVKEFSRLPFSDHDYEEFSKHIDYFEMNFSDKEAYHTLNDYFKKDQIDQHIFYFAVAPRFFSIIVEGLVNVENAHKAKVMIEKPFGENLVSAKVLNEQMESFFLKEHIYRIDHYLGKEMVRNIQTIRFTNPIFTNIWNHETIDYVQISALEDVGVENRGAYYEQSGAIKDMVQNHLLQILSIVAMEKPSENDDKEIHQEQLKVLRSLRPIDSKDIKDTLLLGQYIGYRQENFVAEDSQIETFAALRLFVDNERWLNTPFYIRTGKRTGRREMEVIVVFKKTQEDADANMLVIKIQPEEGVYLQFNIKKPGNSDAIINASMDFCQSCSEENRINTPEAYERLLLACMESKRSWFSKWDQIELSWEYMNQLKRSYKEMKQPIYMYPQGNKGPSEADLFIENSGHHWINQSF